MKNSKDWCNLVNAIVSGNFDNRKVIEGNSFKLHVVVDGDIQGIVVKRDGEVLFSEIYEIPKVLGMNFVVKTTHYENGGQWLKGFSKEEMNKFLISLRDVFFSQGILGTRKGENFLFYCPDIPTLRKWAKVLNLRTLL